MGHDKGFFQGAKSLELWVKTDGGVPDFSINMGGDQVRVARGWETRPPCWVDDCAVQWHSLLPAGGCLRHCSWALGARCANRGCHTCILIRQHAAQGGCQPQQLKALPVLARQGAWSKYSFNLGQASGEHAAHLLTWSWQGSNTLAVLGAQF